MYLCNLSNIKNKIYETENAMDADRHLDLRSFIDILF